jgi:hypothetical protein
MPFPGGGLLDKLRRHAQEQPEALTRLRPEVPAELAAVVERMMAKDPARRYQTAAEVVQALEPFCQPKQPSPVPRPRWRWWAATAGVLLAVAGAIGLALVPRGEKGTPDRSSLNHNGTPMPPVRRPPDLSRMAPLVDDDFSKPNKNLLDRYPQENNEKMWLGMDKGSFVMKLFPYKGSPKDCRYHFSATERIDKGDFACQVVGRILTGGDHGWTLCLIAPKQDRDLGVRVRRDGRIEVGDVIWNNMDPNLLVGPMEDPAVHADDRPNTLLIVCRGGRMLDIYANGSAIGQPIPLEPPFLPVYLGVAVWQRGRGTREELRAEFSRFTLWQLPKVAPRPDP